MVDYYNGQPKRELLPCNAAQPKSVPPYRRQTHVFLVQGSKEWDFTFPGWRAHKPAEARHPRAIALAPCLLLLARVGLGGRHIVTGLGRRALWARGLKDEGRP